MSTSFAPHLNAPGGCSDNGSDLVLLLKACPGHRYVLAGPPLVQSGNRSTTCAGSELAQNSERKW